MFIASNSYLMGPFFSSEKSRFGLHTCVPPLPRSIPFSLRGRSIFMFYFFRLQDKCLSNRLEANAPNKNRKRRGTKRKLCDYLLHVHQKFTLLYVRTPIRWIFVFIEFVASAASVVTVAIANGVAVDAAITENLLLAKTSQWNLISVVLWNAKCFWMM